MSRRPMKRLALALALLAGGGVASAQDLLIRNATVHTASARGTLQATDVLVRNGRIAAIGNGLSAGSATVVDAQGKPLTPTLFGGITDIGVEEVSGESATVDNTLALGANAADMRVRPEFDVTLAYNPESVLVPVARVEGIGWTLLSAGTRPGGSFIGGQGGTVRLDGSLDAIGPRALFVTLGGDGANLSGSSRAAQWMLLDQLIDEVRGRIAPDSQFALLTPAGRTTLAKYFGGGGRVVVRIQRAADIVRLLRWSKQRGVDVAIVGAAEGWKVAPQLAAAGVAGELGTIAIGQRADLVLWSGDPLDVASVARQLWLDGRAIPMRSRQTELRDRYLRAAGTPQEGQLPRAYPAEAR